MKKSSLFTLMAIPFLLASCKQEASAVINQEGANIFPSSAMEETMSITMGDVMPFYDNGVMNIYHLRNVSGTNSLFYHPIARLTTSDFIHYQDEGISLDYEESLTSVDAALGTGSFIKDSNGLYHCFYTGHNGKITDEDLGDQRRPFIEVIRHATSEDQITWTKIEDFNLYGHSNDFRDPYVYYDKDSNCYNMLVTTRDYTKDEFGNDVNLSVIRKYTASSLSARDFEWHDAGNFFVNDDGSYNMECPSYVEYNGVYYLAYSEQGENRVTHYRYRTSNSGDFIRPSRDAIDAAGFYAGRLEKAGDKLYAFAWCARLTGGNTGSFDWAGNLVTHELVKGSNNELNTVIPTSYKEYFNHEVDYKDNQGNTHPTISFTGEGFEEITLAKKSANVTIASMKIKVESEGGNFGLTFGLNSQDNKRLGDGIISFDVDYKKIACFNNVSSIMRYGGELTHVNYVFEKDKEYKVDVAMDGEILSIYLNDEVALTARLVNMTNNFMGFYSQGTKATISEVKFYE